MPTTIEVVKAAQQATGSWDWKTVIDYIALEDKYIIKRANDVKRAMETIQYGFNYLTNDLTPRKVKVTMPPQPKKGTYERRKENGICVKCGKEPARSEKVLCVSCTEAQRVQDAEAWKKRKRRAMG